MSKYTNYGTQYDTNNIYNVYGAVYGSRKLPVRHGVFSGVDVARRVLAPNKNEMLHLVCNTHKMRVLQHKNGNSFIAPNYFVAVVRERQIPDTKIKKVLKI